MLLSLLAIAAVLYLIQRYILDHSFDALSYRLELDRNCAEPDETVRFRTVLTNAKRLPLLFLRLREYIPKEMNVRSRKEGRALRTEAYLGEAVLNQLFYILSFQKIRRELEVSVPRRGRYLLGTSRITCGDLLGISTSTKQMQDIHELVVYPRRCDISGLVPALEGYLGDISVQRFIMPDPIDTVGFREYTGREPMRDISWNKTLTSGKVMVRQYDYTAERKTGLIVDISDADEESIEAAFSTARSIADHLAGKNIAFSFYTNALILSRTAAEYFVPEGRGEKHLNKVKEVLGRSSCTTASSLEKLLDSVTQDRDMRKSFLLVSASGQDRGGLISSYEKRYGIRIMPVEISEGKGSYA